MIASIRRERIDDKTFRIIDTIITSVRIRTFDVLEVLFSIGVSNASVWYEKLNSGFTVIELVVVVAILAIFSVIVLAAALLLHHFL